jgi:predicted SnoaL-like aldol condensation-catalyzing enzyme
LAILCAAAAASGCQTRQAEETARNKALVIHAFERLLVENRIDDADQYLAAGFIEHDPASRDGIPTFKAWFRRYLAQHPHATNHIERVIAEGDLVVVQCHIITDSTNPNDRGLAGVDVFRVADGKLAEHWDVIEPVPAHPSNPRTMW